MQPKTIREHERLLYGSLSHSIADKEIDDLKIIDVAKVIEAGRVHGEYGSQRSVVVLRRLLKFIKESGIKAPFDWRDLEVPKVPHKQNEYLTPDELERVLDALDVDNFAGLRTRTLLEVLYATGMRISEAISLDKKDIDWDIKEAIIINAKTKDMEKVYFTDRCLYWIKRYIDSRKDDLPAVFVSGRGRLLSVTSRNYIRTHLQNLGFKKHIKHHLFRKTFTTHAIQRGAPITDVRYLARHRSPRTTLRYYAVMDAEKAKETHQRIFDKDENLNEFKHYKQLQVSDIIHDNRNIEQDGYQDDFDK